MSRGECSSENWLELGKRERNASTNALVPGHERRTGAPGRVSYRDGLEFPKTNPLGFAVSSKKLAKPGLLAKRWGFPRRYRNQNVIVTALKAGDGGTTNLRGLRKAGGVAVSGRPRSSSEQLSHRPGKCKHHGRSGTASESDDHPTSNF